MAEIELNAGDADRSIATKCDDRMIVTLPESASTGLTWSVQVSAPAVVARQEDSFARSGPLIPGSGGVRRFSFLAVKSGDATLSFKLAYPATGNAVETLVFRISVS
jgi:predicted secreted protein